MFDHRYLDRENGSFTLPSIRAYRPIMPLYDLSAKRKPQARSIEPVLRIKPGKGFEN